MGNTPDTAKRAKKHDCRAGKDGDCIWKKCPQLRDNEPARSGRHCPLDNPEELV